MIYVGEIYGLCQIRYAKEIIAISMISEIIKQLLDKESFASKQEYQAKLDYHINCLTNDDDSYDIALALKEQIINSTNSKYGVHLNKHFVNKLPIKYMESELRRVCNVIINDKSDANKDKDKYKFIPKFQLPIPDKYISNEDINKSQCSMMESIQTDLQKLRNEQEYIINGDKFESFRNSCFSLMNRVDIVFRFHVFKYDIMHIICQTYLKIVETEKIKKWMYVAHYLLIVLLYQDSYLVINIDKHYWFKLNYLNYLNQATN